MELDLFLRTDLSRCVLFMTDMLSPYANYGPDKGTPIIQSLYHKPRKASMPIFIATNSAPTTDVLMVGCLFENQIIGYLFRKMK